MRDYSKIDQAEAELLTGEIQIALELGETDRAAALAYQPAFVVLCHRLHTTPVIALRRLKEQVGLEAPETGQGDVVGGGQGSGA